LAQLRYIFAENNEDMDSKNKDFNDVMAIELAFMMGKYGNSESLLDSIREMKEEFECFSF